ncbi:MAG: fibronectin type III domain-containing protein [Myxococcaceae bacterium]
MATCRTAAATLLVVLCAACPATVGSGPDAGNGASVPTAPTNLVAVAGDQSASLTWAAPASTGGSPISAYDVVVSPTMASAQIVVSGTSASVTRLSNGTAYTFTVAAVNAVGTGPASLPSSAVTPMAPLPGVPTAPSNVTATPGIASAALSWTTPSSSGGSPITGYTVTITPPAQGAVITISGTTASVTGLANGTTYTFAVAASNAVGTGPASLSGPVMTFDVPGAPTNVVANPGEQAVTLSWTAPASTGGSPVTSYVIASPEVASPQVTFAGPTSAVVTSLTDGTSYTFTVAAVNAVGTGPASLPSSPATPEPPSGPPSNLAYSTNPAVYTVGTLIPLNSPSSSGGAVASYSVSPALPPGLELNTVTGVISGTPTTPAATANYTVTATNVMGSTTVALSITVASASGPGVPTLVQSVSYGGNAPARGLLSSQYTFPMPNTWGAGNCVVVFLDLTHGTTVSSLVDDAGNTWPTTAVVSADAGSGKMVSGAYVLPNVNAGGRTLTLTLSKNDDNVKVMVQEWAGVSLSSPVGATASSIMAAAPTINLPSMTVASGSLLLHYALDNTGLLGSGAPVASMTAGAGWTLQHADLATGGGSNPNMNFFGLQSLVAQGTSITPTLTTSGNHTVNTYCLELRSASGAGTPLSSGMRVLKMAFVTNINITASPYKVPWPTAGNLIVVLEDDGSLTEVPTDSNGNTWALPVRGDTAPVTALAYAKATPSQTNVISFAVSGTPINTTYWVLDIVGADPVNPYVQSVKFPVTSEGTSWTGTPVITPQRQNGIIVNWAGTGIGPILTMTSPSDAYYVSVNYPGETDNDTFDNANGASVSYYGTDLSPQSYGYTMDHGTTINATAGEFGAPQ